jgi:hypothetical protein
MYTIYKDDVEICTVENIVQRGDSWSFEDGTGNEITQKLIVTNVNDFIIKDDTGKVITLAVEPTVEQRLEATEQALVTMMGVLSNV